MNPLSYDPDWEDPNGGEAIPLAKPRKNEMPMPSLNISLQQALKTAGDAGDIKSLRALAIQESQRAQEYLDLLAAVVMSCRGAVYVPKNYKDIYPVRRLAMSVIGDVIKIEDATRIGK